MVMVFGNPIVTPTGIVGPRGGAFIIGQADFNLDGYEDLVVGSFHIDWVQLPLAILLGQGDGTFQRAFEEDLAGFDATNPLIEIADFNGDGRPDIFLVDRDDGAFDGAQHPEFGGFSAGPPHLLLSTDDGGFVQVDDIQDAYLNIPRYTAGEMLFTNTVYTKRMDSGDIDNDGDIDIFLEGQGAFPWGKPHFLINDGSGNFTIDWDTRLTEDTTVIDGGNDRSFDVELADFDGDGFLDVVMGKLGARNNNADDARSIVVLNDGTGNFPAANRILLPNPDFNDGFVQVDQLNSIDIDADGDLDLIMHSTPTSENAELGSFTQILINEGGSFFDETATRIDNSNPAFGSVDEHNANIVDMNGDGHPDFVVTRWNLPAVPNRVIFLNDGEGYFAPAAIEFPLDLQDTTLRAPPPFDATGNGVLDFVNVNGWEDPDVDVRVWPGRFAWGSGPDLVDSAPLGAPGFNEQYYLRTNPDAAAAVAAGTFASGLAHYLAIGMGEGRLGFAAGTHVTGTGASERIDLREGDEEVRGLGGDDTLRGGPGDDLIDGGAGSDRAEFAGPLAAYVIAEGPEAVAVTGPDGADTVIAVEVLVFADSMVFFDDRRLSEPEAREVAYLYEAGLDRDGDIDKPGLNFWIDQREMGLSPVGLAQFFLDSPEFAEVTGDPASLTDRELVEALYLNVLDRPGETLGVDFWTGVVADPGFTRADLLLAFAVSPENLAGSPFVETLVEVMPGTWDFA